MSYILDALKRADQDRRVGVLPADSQSPPMPEVAGVAHRTRSWTLAVRVGVGLLLGVAAALAWHHGRGSATLPSVASVASLPSLPSPPAQPVVAAVNVAAPTSMAAVSVPPLSAPPMHPAPAPAVPPAPQPIAAAPAPFLPQAASPVPPAKAPAPGPQRSPSAQQPETPEPLLRFKLSGSIYSTRAADRLLIVDGQIAHEGDRVAPEVVLERIQPKSAIFLFRQRRYELSY